MQQNILLIATVSLTIAACGDVSTPDVEGVPVR